MRKVMSSPQRLKRFLSQLPEIFANMMRFRVFFILPRWFTMPAQVNVARRSIPLRHLDEEGIDADFLCCFLRNTYGLGRVPDPVRTIIDVGANVGFFSLAAREFYPNAIIHAYEPNPRILPLLRANTSELEIQIHPEAVGDRDCHVLMIDNGPSDQARTRISDSDQAIRQVTIETLIERIGGIVDLLKLDCEGAEWEILKPNPCWRDVRNIRMEYHLYERGSVPELRAVIEGLGFRLVRCSEDHEFSGTIWAVQTAGR
jgi:FkbM family methyltransferase